MNRTLAAIHRVLCPGGVLLLGWHLYRIPDPLELENARTLFEIGSALELPDRKCFDDVPREDRHDSWAGGRWVRCHRVPVWGLSAGRPGKS